jgi:hypothetical protein
MALSGGRLSGPNVFLEIEAGAGELARFELQLSARVLRYARGVNGGVPPSDVARPMTSTTIASSPTLSPPAASRAEGGRLRCPQRRG